MWNALLQRVHLQPRATLIFNSSHCGDAAYSDDYSLVHRIDIALFIIVPLAKDGILFRGNTTSVFASPFSPSILAICGGISSDRSHFNSRPVSQEIWLLGRKRKWHRLLPQRFYLFHHNSRPRFGPSFPSISSMWRPLIRSFKIRLDILKIAYVETSRKPRGFHIHKKEIEVPFLGVFKFRPLFIPTVESGAWLLM